MDQIPDGETLEKARELEVFDASGQKIKFGDIVTTTVGTRKTVVVFIRVYTILPLSPTHV